MGDDLEAEYGLLVLDFHFTVFNGLIGHLITTFNNGFLIIDGRNGGAGKDVDLAVLLKSGELGGEDAVTHVF